MGSTPGSARSVIAGLLAIMLAAAVTQGTAHAQSAPPPSGSAMGAYVGVSVGVYFETGESRGRTAGISISGIAGDQFNDRWAMQGEFGRNGEVCNRATVNNKPKNVCHRDPLFSLDAVRRFEAGSVRPYVAFGFGMGQHVGTGVEVPFGGQFAIVPAVDINLLPDMLSARPKLAQLVRF